MKKEIVQRLHVNFENAANEQDGIEYWFARDLQELLEYTQWRNFLSVIEKAQTACSNAGQVIDDHFVEVSKKVSLGSGAKREVQDFMLSRFACYLIAQNGDPAKEQIAFAQTYFAVQTRKQELIEERLLLMERLKAREKLEATETELSRLIYERGVDNQGFAMIRSKGDSALFGGIKTADMKKRLGTPDNRPLADFLPTITIKAKDFAAEITSFNIKRDDLKGENDITKEHVKNNSDVRKLLVKRNIKPEELPAEEDIRKMERRLSTETKKSLQDVPKLKKPRKDRANEK
jgi:DNA-damage-inducible protein D